jgi:hypothetical protein
LEKSKHNKEEPKEAAFSLKKDVSKSKLPPL